MLAVHTWRSLKERGCLDLQELCLQMAMRQHFALCDKLLTEFVDEDGSGEHCDFRPRAYVPLQVSPAQVKVPILHAEPLFHLGQYG